MIISTKMVNYLALKEFSTSYWPFQRRLYGLETGFRHLMRIKLVNVGPLAGKCVGGPVTYSLLGCDHSILQDTGERNATH